MTLSPFSLGPAPPVPREEQAMRAPKNVDYGRSASPALLNYRNVNGGASYLHYIYMGFICIKTNNFYIP
jgi:hypothetical protein